MPSKTATPLLDNPHDAWFHLREDVGIKMHGNIYSTVPLLNEAKTFDMLTVYVKRSQRSGCLTRLCSPYRYQMVGWLRDLVKVPECTKERLQSLLPRQLPIKVDGNEVFEFTTTNGKLDREAIIRIYNFSIETSDVISIKPGEIFVDKLSPELQNVETVYILSEVILCRRFYFFLRLEARQIVLNLPYDRLPIAFRSVKFYIDNNGGLVYKHEAKVCNDTKVKWISCGVFNDDIQDKPPLPPSISNLVSVSYSQRANLVSVACPTARVPHLINPDADLSRDHQKSMSERSSAESSGQTSKEPSRRVSYVEHSSRHEIRSQLLQNDVLQATPVVTNTHCTNASTDCAGCSETMVNSSPKN